MLLRSHKNKISRCQKKIATKLKSSTDAICSAARTKNIRVVRISDLQLTRIVVLSNTTRDIWRVAQNAQAVRVPHRLCSFGIIRTSWNWSRQRTVGNGTHYTWLSKWNISFEVWMGLAEPGAIIAFETPRTEDQALQFHFQIQRCSRNAANRTMVSRNLKKMLIDIIKELIFWRCRLPLTIRWLKQEYEQEFSINKMPPPHIPIVYGPVKIVKKQAGKQVTGSQNQSSQPSKSCFLCKSNTSETNRMRCIKCHVETHMTCLSKHFLNKETDQIMPIEGDCPKCKQCFLWYKRIMFDENVLKKLWAHVWSFPLGAIWFVSSLDVTRIWTWAL